MMGATNSSAHSQPDVLDNLMSLLEQEAKLTASPNLQELYDRLFRDLYRMREFSIEFEPQSSTSMKSKILRFYRRIWKIGALPYIRYHNQFHATLINTIFMQHAIIKELEATITKGQHHEDRE